ncbi:MAG: phosphogluconate dehydratase [Gammaproteobacteria bacterium]|nr:phosphogluconate dehydratase [Gammaproteobacteria bacterium]MDH3409055.1 phosphogluconate dehydratase [Gammaproteobacteria bacterium]MDH3551252.1 phosphogluconate dehydratase [Gammaproteobacteria bacterium]
MGTKVNPVIDRVTRRIQDRSQKTRADYLARVRLAANEGPSRSTLSCSNLAHGIAACGQAEKDALAGTVTPNIGIVSAYNDMLSAHQPFDRFPELIKQAAAAEGAMAQFAGGVPAMCDGVTQGQDGMDLSLFSRDVIAMSTAIALSHNMFDAALCLGICDKIVPGLLIGTLSFGHLPVVFVPAGPMLSGLPNKEKARIREEYAAGRVGRDELLAAESASYHSAGTCTFYGTANSNQMLMEFMGLQLPGGSFVNPGTELRAHLTTEAVRTVLRITDLGDNYTPIGHIVDEKAIVNALVGLLASGGSTNHTLHLVAIAAAGGVLIDWNDFAELSKAVPLLARVYPNGLADVNHFHAAGGLGYMIGQLLDAGMLHEDVQTILGPGMRNFCMEPVIDNSKLKWQASRTESLDSEVLRPVDDPFDNEGGLRVVDGNVGRAIVKVSAVAEEHYAITAPARVFDSQAAFIEAFNNGELEMDFVAVLPNQGPRANGMPELHKLTPYLGVLQNRGFKVALLTDGRMSGASGKVLAAIQVTPESVADGTIGKIRNDDLITIDSNAGVLSVSGEDDAAARHAKCHDLTGNHTGMGRELFTAFRTQVSSAETGASIFAVK